MLQWMGGSRRKVTTSRKSIQKRQKQYFEQKRRQQHQQVVGSEESCEGGGNNWEQSHKEHKSLDILNLLNFSTASQDCKTDCPTSSRKDDLKINNSTVEYHMATDAPVIQASTVIPTDSDESQKAGSLLDCQVETLSPKKVVIGSLDNHNNSFYGVDNKVDLLNAATRQQASVFDLLGDDELNGYLQEHPSHEAHVAFSVDGLGKVKTETPPQSPQPDRHISYGGFSPLKTARQLNSSRNHNRVLNGLELEVDAIMHDLEIPLSCCSLEFSTGMEDSYSKLKKNLSADRDWMQLDNQGSKVRRSVSYGQAFCNAGKIHEDIWDARASLLAADFLDERQCDKSWKSQSCYSDDDSAEFLNYGRPNYAFRGPHLLKKRDASKTIERFNFLDSPPTKHQKSEKEYDFLTSKGARHHSVPTNVSFEDITALPEWSSFVLEDSKESPSLLSEESCSSTAVKGEASNSPIVPRMQNEQR